MEIAQSLALFFVAFVLLWIGSGLAVGAITKISRSLRMSSFFVSFFVLGLFTSLTEIMVGINSVIDQQPQIFVGNLIGSSVVMFLFVVPLLAVLGNGASLNHSFSYKSLVTATLVAAFPAILTLDGSISLVDALICMIIYTYFVYVQEKNNSSLSRLINVNFGRSTIYKSVLKIIVALVLVFLASDILVNQTTNLGNILGISPFLISVLAIAVGTNIPEISIAIRAVLSKKKDVAFGNYLGSASLNTLVLGVLSLFSQRPIPVVGSGYANIIFLVSMLAFLYFGKSRNDISRNEGMLLLLCYFLFVFLQINTGPGWHF